jgi:hypothetical protein
MVFAVAEQLVQEERTLMRLMRLMCLMRPLNGLQSTDLSVRKTV